MGYDLHITRKEDWADEEDSQSISIDEWNKYIENDSEVVPDPENPGGSDFLYLRKAGDWPLWFNSDLGEVYTKNPEVDVIAKMVRISSALKAKVCGDDGEFYDADGNVLTDQGIVESLADKPKKPWWKLW
ncbi:MAG: hypothetical protein OMM_14698 [Candidatus Magnetoglobus multicellularis str. Araruama]|uniref:Uncharacterized protein n=1 Tax=Candidatus Magnetoglobus multicellularis str. Araruama TaxID=890399 RepID=A0A1V1NRF2_9BACT|nr:MAG: hypothetical protein OMM_14698 [Candidatus Magnetoglobus multicellularis str. Araruama]